MAMLDVQTVVYREGDHFVAQCLDVDISSFGSSESDALANLREALELYFEDAPADAIDLGDSRIAITTYSAPAAPVFRTRRG
jgi:predicted RNase H-like HicB family nuclease